MITMNIHHALRIEVGEHKILTGNCIPVAVRDITIVTANERFDITTFADERIAPIPVAYSSCATQQDFERVCDELATVRAELDELRASVGSDSVAG